VKIWRVGQEQRIRFQNGEPDGPLESFLLDKALADAHLTYANGYVHEKEDLRREVNLLREASHNLKRLSSVIPVALLEQAAIAGVLTPDAVRATACAPEFATRLNAVLLPTKRGWVVSADNGLTLSGTVRGVAERYALEPPRCAARRRGGWRNGQRCWHSGSAFRPS
jgi:DNA gyrase subunit B